MKQWSVGILIATAVFSGGSARLNAAEIAGERPPVIILKLDDLSSKGLKGKTEVRAAWRILDDYLASRNLKYSVGVHCETFADDHAPTIDWIKRHQASGNVEFWCHGFRSARNKLPDGKLEPAEFEGNFEEQKATLRKCQDLAVAKLGFPLRAFGAHWSGVNAGTARALKEIPEFTIWLHSPPELLEQSGKYGYLRYMALENPIFEPSPEAFKKAWDKVGKSRKVLILQGHPEQWGWEPDTRRWQGFRAIIDFLVSQGCVFETPTGYYEKYERRQAAPAPTRSVTP